MAITVALIDYIVQHYGQGGSLNSDGSSYDSFTDHLMLEDFGTEIMPRPFPSGVSLSDLMLQTVVAMLADNPGATKDYLYDVYTGEFIPPGEKDAWMSICTHIPGATVYIDDVAQVAKTNICYEWTKYPVESGKLLNIELELLPTYPRAKNRCTKPCAVPLVPGQTRQWTHVLDGIVGTETGTLIIKAHDKETGQSLAAKAAINGTTLEDDRLCPIELVLEAPKDYDFTLTYPGFLKTEPVALYLTKNQTQTFDVEMEAVEIWKEVEVRETGVRDEWITGFTIPNTLVWNVLAKGTITFHFEKQKQFDAYFDLHPMPAGWGTGYDLDNLPASKKTIRAIIEPDNEAGELIPWEHDYSYKAKWEYTVEESLPAGRYVAVASIAYWTD